MKKKGARILVVDDEPEVARLLQRSLSAHDFQVFATTNAKDPVLATWHIRSCQMMNSANGCAK